MTGIGDRKPGLPWPIDRATTDPLSGTDHTTATANRHAPAANRQNLSIREDASTTPAPDSAS